MPTYLVDGNNLEAYLAQERILRAADDHELVAWIGRWLAGRKRKRGKAPNVLVFLDSGAKGKPLRTSQGLVVKVAPETATADDLILQELRRLRAKGGKRDAVVVTSDRALAEQARLLGAETLGVREFAGKVAPPQPKVERDEAQDKAQIARELGRSLDDAFLPEKERGPKQPPPKRSRLSPGKVRELRDPGRLLELLREGDRTIRRRAVQALARIGTESGRKALERVVTADPVPSVRAAAAEALAQVGDAQSLGVLLKAAGDASPLVRVAAAKALARYDAPQAREALARLQKDPSRRVQKATLSALKGAEKGS